MIAASNCAIACAAAACRLTHGSSQSRAIVWPADCPASTSTSPRSCCRRRTARRGWPDSTLTGQTCPSHAEQRSQAFDRGQEIAAVSLHHREQQVAAGVTAERAARASAGARAARRRASRSLRASASAQRKHVARRQHAELVAELPRAAPAVEHGHDRVQVQPGIGLQSAEQAGQTGAAPETADVEPAQFHLSPLHWRSPRIVNPSRSPRSVVRVAIG